MFPKGKWQVYFQRVLSSKDENTNELARPVKQDTPRPASRSVQESFSQDHSHRENRSTEFLRSGDDGRIDKNSADSGATVKSKREQSGYPFPHQPCLQHYRGACTNTTCEKSHREEAAPLFVMFSGVEKLIEVDADWAAALQDVSLKKALCDHADRLKTRKLGGSKSKVTSFQEKSSDVVVRRGSVDQAKKLVAGVRTHV